MNRDEQILSCKLDRRIYKQMVEFCENRGMKIRFFVETAIIAELERIGRYGKKSTAKFTERSK